MRAYFSKRFFSYIIDIVIITILIACITRFIPVSNKTNKLYKNLEETSAKLNKEEIDIQKYLEITNNINYEISKENIFMKVMEILIYIIYFTVYQAINNGQTIGKRLMKIKVKKKNGDNPTKIDLLIRTLILYGTFVNIIMLCAIIILGKNDYIRINTIFSTIQIVISIISIVMIIVKKDGRGLHDVIAGTTVSNFENLKS